MHMDYMGTPRYTTRLSTVIFRYSMLVLRYMYVIPGGRQGTREAGNQEDWGTASRLGS